MQYRKPQHSIQLFLELIFQQFKLYYLSRRVKNYRILIGKVCKIYLFQIYRGKNKINKHLS